MNLRFSIIFPFILLISSGCGKERVAGIAHTPTSESNNREIEPNILIPTGKVEVSPRVPKFKTQGIFLPKSILSKEDRRYINIQTNILNKKTNFNFRFFKDGLRHLIISGKRLVIVPGHSQGLFEVLNNSPDLYKVILESEEIVFGGKLNLPSTHLTIKAENVIFNSNSQISTIPLAKETRPEQFANGEKGLTAGRVELWGKQVSILPRKIPLFLLGGGKGQSAGLGQDGTVGSSITAISNNILYRCFKKRIEVCDLVIGKDKRETTRCREDYKNVCEGRNTWPQNGSNALAGGIPGNGGQGGIFITNQGSLLNWTSLKGGDSGERADSYTGGNPGNPNPAIHNIYGRIISKRFKSGKSVDSPAAFEPVGKKGRFKIIQSKTNWIGKESFKHSYLYAKDAFLAGHRLLAKEEFQKISKNITLNDAYKDDNDLKLLNQKSIVWLQKLSTHLDYFGNPLTWVPSLSFESNLSLFNTEINNSLDTLYLSYWLKKHFNNVNQMREGLEASSLNLFKDISQKREQHTTGLKKIPLLKKKVENLKIEEAELQFLLKELEIKIYDMARRNVIDRNKVPFFKKALKVLAAVSKVVPAGQPAFGVIANSLNQFVQKIDPEDVWGSLSNLPSLYSTIDNADMWKESSESWNKRWSKIKYSHYKSLKKEERSAYFSNLVKFSSPIIQEAMSQRSLLKSREVPKGEIQLEIHKIKSAHPMFKKVTMKLEKLLINKEVYIAEVRDLLINLSSIQNIINDNFNMIAKFQEKGLNLEYVLDPSIKSDIEHMANNSTDRLQLYFYKIVKAYEYRLLKNYNGSLNLQALREKMLLLADTESNQLSLEQFNSLKGVYTEQLANILNKALEWAEINPEYRNKQTFKLNSNELHTLNQKKPIYINILNPNFYGKDKENIRIVNVKVKDIKVNSISLPERFGLLSINIEHNGRSYLQRNEQIFSFNLANHQRNKWVSHFDLLTDQLEHREASPAMNSLLSTLIGNHSEDLMLFNRPGGLTSLKITLDKLGEANLNSKLEEVILEIQYDYQEKI